MLAHRIVLAPEAVGVERASDRRRRARGDAGAVERGRGAERPCARSAARRSGSSLLLVAGTFDAEPLYVPGSALALLGARRRRGWVAAGASGRAVERDARRAQRASRSEPLPVRDRRARRRAAAAARRGSTSRCCPSPCALRAGRRATRVRVEVRFARRGRRAARAAGARRCATRSGSPQRVVTRRRTRTRCSCCRACYPVARRRRRRRGACRARARPRSIAAAEIEIDGLRQHREGTPASRIHWPALARGAGLMERQLISEADSRPLVVLDPRAPASQDALDAAVRAAASLLLHFARRGGCALLLPGDRRADDGRARPARPGRSRTRGSRWSTTRPARR